MANEAVVVLTDSNFQEEVINSSVPVFVDFWATWCGPCKMMAAIVDELAQEYAGLVKVGQVNVDENPATAGQYKIMSIPSFLFFKDGKVKDQLIGAIPKQKLKSKVAEFIA